MDTLNSTAKGKDFDKAYIDAEVDVHKAVLDIGFVTSTSDALPPNSRNERFHRR